MPELKLDIPEQLMRALEEQHRRTGDSIERIALDALVDAFNIQSQTLYQVSTSAALVKGVFDGTVTIADLQEHCDFGLGTFDELDGEMIAFDGDFYQVRGTGEVCRPPGSAEVPFAVVTRFKCERQFELPRIDSFADLEAKLDGFRQTNNLFYAVRIDGEFSRIKTRSVFPAHAGETLVEAAAGQVEFDLHDVAGTMVGFWTPEYARTLSVAGWHLHFLTDDRKAGGHVLACEAGPVRVQLQDLADVRIAMPETAEFLSADLEQDPTTALSIAEREHRIT